ncbi:hypothetical protein G3I24_49350, partial [Micromonospora aurantiaca]|nr:hypothetical protein [Micromonospora aurantiaca]
MTRHAPPLGGFRRRSSGARRPLILAAVLTLAAAFLVSLAAATGLAAQRDGAAAVPLAADNCSAGYVGLT